VSMNPGSSPLSRWQAASARSISRRAVTGRRDRSGARVRVTGLPPENPKLNSELNDIFSQLHDLGVSISDANHTIDELRKSTRSIIGDIMGKG
jgi:hypothetical protein